MAAGNLSGSGVPSHPRSPLPFHPSTAGRCPLSLSLLAICKWSRAGASPLRKHGQLLSLSSGEVVTPQKPLPHPEPRLNNHCTAWDQQLHSLGSGLRTKQPSPVPSSLPFPATRPMSLFHCPHACS